MISTQTFDSYPEFGDSSTKVAPDSAKYAAGFSQSDVLPAEWMNWAWAHNTKGITDLNTGLSSTEAELNALVEAGGQTPSVSSSNQVLTAVNYLINAVTGTLSNLATTVKTNLVLAINSHVNNTSNPHSVTGAQLAGQVPTDNIADSAVTTDKINDLAVTTGKINSSAVTTDKLNDSAVTAAKLADGAVTLDKIPSSNRYYAGTFLCTTAANTAPTITLDLDLTDQLSLKVIFQNGYYSTESAASMTLNSKPIYVNKHGTPSLFTGKTLTSETDIYRFLQAYTTLELCYLESLGDAGGWLILDPSTIVLSASSDTSGYTVQADGFIEQWGAVSSTTISLPVAYSDTNYTAQAMPRGTTSSYPSSDIRIYVALVRQTTYITVKPVSMSTSGFTADFYSGIYSTKGY